MTYARHELAYDASLDPISPHFDPRSWTPMADRPCDEVACRITTDRHGSCTACGYPGSCHEY